MSPPNDLEVARQSEGLLSALDVLRRRWLVIVGVVIACVVVLAVSHEHKAKSYSATASVAFQSGTLPDAALQVSTAGSTEPQREADTEELIAHSLEVAQGVRKQLHLSTEANELLNAVKVEVAPNADVLNVVASTGNPAYSARLANAFAEQYIAFRTQSELAGIESAQSQLQAQIAALPAGSAELTNLQQLLQRVGELRAVAGGGANVIGRATPPTSASGMKLSTTIVIGILVGLALAFSVVFLMDLLDRRVRTLEEFEREYRLPALATVPRTAFRAGRADQRTESLEPYRILRSALEFAAVTRQLDTLMVTSAISEEGKTTVAVDLAHAIALTGRRTVLLELDLRRPTFVEHFGLRAKDGLTTALTGARPLAELLVAPLADVPDLLVLPSGRLPHNPSELLSSPRVTELISELANGETTVIIDSPPLNPVADAQVLLGNEAIHATMIVARIDRTTREQVHRARGILDHHGIEPVGLVITGVHDGGRYGYDRYHTADPLLETEDDAGSHDETAARATDGSESQPLRR